MAPPTGPQPEPDETESGDVFVSVSIFWRCLCLVWRLVVFVVTVSVYDDYSRRWCFLVYVCLLDCFFACLLWFVCSSVHFILFVSVAGSRWSVGRAAARDDTGRRKTQRTTRDDRDQHWLFACLIAYSFVFCLFAFSAPCRATRHLNLF